MCYLNVSAAEINFHGWGWVGLGGWLNQLRLKLTQSPTEVGVKVGTELGNSNCNIMDNNNKDKK